MKNTFLLFAFLLVAQFISAQTTWNITGNTGTTAGTNFIGTTDAKDFVFKTNNTEKGRVKSNGVWQFGATGNLAKFDSAGNFSFVGTAAYRVGANKYAFQYASNPNYGLFFNATGLQYEFKDASAGVGFSVGANNGNGYFKGSVGIGVTTPTAKLQIKGSTNATQLIVQANATQSNTNPIIKLQKSDGTDLIWINSDDVTNVFIGTNAGRVNNFSGGGLSNIFIGNAAGYSNTIGNDNTANGFEALRSNSTGNRNTAMGHQSLFGNTTGNDNSAFGLGSLLNNTDGYSNSAFGEYSLYANSHGYQNTATGKDALFTNISGYNNTANGFQTLYSNTTGSNNTANGFGALQSNTTAVNNTATGYFALSSNTTGSSNTATGTAALQLNTTGTWNSAHGYQALYSNTTGSNNTANGQGALGNNTTAIDNTADGYFALRDNTTGNYNTAVGAVSLKSNTTGSQNTAIGVSSLEGNTTGLFNTAVGHNALLQNTTGSYSTANGNDALFSNTIGSHNTANGVNALYSNTTGFRNTALGDSAFFTGANYSNSTALGAQTVISASNQARIGNASVTSIGGQVGWTTVSDARLKQNIQPSNLGLDFILKLKPVTYNYKAEGQKGILYTGFIAQEVEKAANEIGTSFSGVDAPKNDQDVYGLRYAEFVVPLVKAVQELDSLNTIKDNKIAEQQNQIESLNSKLDEVLNKMNNFETSLSQCCSNYQSSNTNGQSSIVNDIPKLEQNIPNPFIQNCYIKFYIPSSATNVSITVSDINGKVVKTFNNLSTGFGTVNINGGELSAGTYQYTLIINNAKVETKQMVLTK